MNHISHRWGVERLAGPLLCLLLCHIADSPAGIYRWQDTSGATHYGDSPPVVARELKQLHPTAYDSYGLVARVIDGDTLDLADGRRIRLLGINTPEVAHHGRPGEPLGEQAKQFLKTQVEGKQVRLRYDLQHRDHYQRWLAHLYLEDGRDINALLLQRGLAHALFKWPNLENAGHYYVLEKKARRLGLGIWALPAFQVKSLDGLKAQRNRFTRRVTRVEQRRHDIDLQFGDRLIVAVKRSRLPLFTKSGIGIDSLKGHHIVLRGWLSRRHGTPYLKLEHPFQLEKVE
jgi:micrococcal nuclease